MCVMEDEHPRIFDDTPRSPGQHLRELLRQKKWTQDDLAAITGRSRQQINRIISGEHGITAEMAVALSAALGTSARYWLDLDAAYRLAMVREDASPVESRARLFDLVPIKDMQRRGWIGPSKSIAEIELSLKQFFGTESLDRIPDFPVSTRKSVPLSDLTPEQQVWCFRARQMAEALPVKKFDASKMEKVTSELRRLAAYPKEVLRLPEFFAENGIRFVVIEPIASCRIDGAAFWLDEESPVIAVSVRYDRIDAFWFTVMHEFAHIKHGDGLSVDDALVGDDAVEALVKDEKERLADESAAASLVPPKELDSFIRRVAPLYSKKRIIQFANRIKMHPGIIVGQLQFRGEIGYASHRDLLLKVRNDIVQVAFTDGWGKTISPETL